MHLMGMLPGPSTKAQNLGLCWICLQTDVLPCVCLSTWLCSIPHTPSCFNSVWVWTLPATGCTFTAQWWKDPPAIRLLISLATQFFAYTTLHGRCCLSCAWGMSSSSACSTFSTTSRTLLCGCSGWWESAPWCAFSNQALAFCIWSLLPETWPPLIWLIVRKRGQRLNEKRERRPSKMYLCQFCISERFWTRTVSFFLFDLSSGISVLLALIQFLHVCSDDIRWLSYEELDRTTVKHWFNFPLHPHRPHRLTHLDQKLTCLLGHWMWCCLAKLHFMPNLPLYF